MGKSIAKVGAPNTMRSLPSLPDHTSIRKRADLHNQLEPAGIGYRISDRRAPSPALRQELEQRRKILQNAMGCSDDLDLAEVIMALFDNYPTVRMDKAKTANVTAAYLEQVGHIPLWALLAGRDECVSRDTAFPPSAGELRAASERAMEDYQDEYFQLSHILDAEVYVEISDEERARVREGLAQLARDISTSNSMDEASKRRRATDARDMPQEPQPMERNVKGYIDTPVTLSDKLVDQLNGLRPIGEGALR